jgi:hypothetical protein
MDCDALDQTLRRWLGSLRNGGRLRRSLIWAVIVVSLGANVALAGYQFLFEPSVRLRPVCYDRRTHDLVVMETKMRPKFHDYVIRNWPVEMKIDRNKNILISRWVWWMDKDQLWELTTKAAVEIYVKLPKTVRERGDAEWYKCNFLYGLVAEYYAI